MGVPSVLPCAGGRLGLGSELLPDLWEDFGAEQLDALEEGGVRHAADVHLQDLARVAQELVQVEDALGDFVRPADEDHPARLIVDGATDPERSGAADLRHRLLEHPRLVVEVGLLGLVVVVGDVAWTATAMSAASAAWPTCAQAFL